MSFYDDVMRELVTALGAALFLGNVFALARRRRDARDIPRRTVARARPGSPVRPNRRRPADADLARAPLGRSLLYLVVGLVVMIWGIGSMVAT